jgi:hypothetical protein
MSKGAHRREGEANVYSLKCMSLYFQDLQSKNINWSDETMRLYGRTKSHITDAQSDTKLTRKYRSPQTSLHCQEITIAMKSWISLRCAKGFDRIDLSTCRSKTGNDAKLKFASHIRNFRAVRSIFDARLLTWKRSLSGSYDCVRTLQSSSFPSNGELVMVSTRGKSWVFPSIFSFLDRD